MGETDVCEDDRPVRPPLLTDHKATILDFIAERSIVSHGKAVSRYEFRTILVQLQLIEPVLRPAFNHPTTAMTTQRAAGF